MNKFLTIIFGLILGFAAMQAQTPDAINWRISVKMKSATEGVVNLRASLPTAGIFTARKCPRVARKPLRSALPVARG